MGVRETLTFDHIKRGESGIVPAGSELASVA